MVVKPDAVAHHTSSQDSIPRVGCISKSGTGRWPQSRTCLTAPAEERRGDGCCCCTCEPCPCQPKDKVAHVFALLDGHPLDAQHSLHAQLLHRLPGLLLGPALLAAEAALAVVCSRGRDDIVGSVPSACASGTPAGRRRIAGLTELKADSRRTTCSACSANGGHARVRRGKATAAALWPGQLQIG